MQKSAKDPCGSAAGWRSPVPSVEDMSKILDQDKDDMSLKPVSEGKRMSMDAVRPSPWNTMEDGMNRNESAASLASDDERKIGVGDGAGDGKGSNPPSRGGSRHGGTFLSVAHLHGLCSLDELIAACHSCGCEPLADELERVKESLRDERIAELKEAGVKTTDSSNALLDTMRSGRAVSEGGHAAGRAAAERRRRRRSTPGWRARGPRKG